MELEEKIKEFYEMFPCVPNPEHYPKTFQYYVKVFLSKKRVEENENI
jgi:hypothetical protein